MKNIKGEMRMSIEKFKKLYISCQKSKKPYYIKKIRELNIAPSLIIEDLRDSDMVLCIGKPDRNMEEEILQAREYGINTQYINENLVSESLMEDMLNNRLSEDNHKYYAYEEEYEL